MKSLKKCGVYYTLDDNYDVLFEESESSNHNKSNDKWRVSDEDVTGFCGQ